MKNDHPAQAISVLNRALEISPNDVELIVQLGQAYAAEMRWDDVENTFTSAVSRMPDNLQMRRVLGTWLLRRDHYLEALPHFEFCVVNWAEAQENSGPANVQSLLAICYILSGDIESAERLLQSARSEAPWDLDACSGMVDLYRLSDRLELIPELLEQYIQLYPSLYPPYFWLASHNYYYLRQPQSALKWYQLALDRIENVEIRKYCEPYFSTPDYATMLDIYLNALLDSGEDLKARTLIDNIKENNKGNHGDVRFYMLQYGLSKGNFHEVEKLAIKALGAKKKNIIFWTYLAIAQEKQGKFEQAFESINQALTLNAESVFALTTLASIQMNQKLWEAAIMTNQRLTELMPLSSSSIADLGACYANTDQLDKALSLYQKVVKLDPMGADAWVDLGDIYLRLGKAELAQSACERGLSYEWLSPDKRAQAAKIIESIQSKQTLDDSFLIK